MTLLNRGNTKLGKDVWHTNLPAGVSCPGASNWCELHCYAKKGFYRMPTTTVKYADNLALLREDPGAYEAQLGFELAKLKPGSVVRVHTSGDLESVEHIGIWARVAAGNEHITFYLYTRSHAVPKLRAAIERDLFPVANMHVWASTDESMSRAPSGWREARVFDTAEEAREGTFGVVCPEQTGKRASCTDCGLCWNAKPNAKLAFVSH